MATQKNELSDGVERADSGSGRRPHAGGWIFEHVNGLRVFGVVVAGIFLVFGANGSGWSLLLIVIGLAVYLGLLQLVALWARRVSGSVANSGAT